MSTKLIIKQANTAELVTSALVDKIYQLAATEGALTNDSDLEGTITVNGAVYEDAVDYLRNRFPRLIVNASAFYIRFADPEVVRVLTAQGVIVEGEGITIAQAAVANVPFRGLFLNNTVVKSFDELYYFDKYKTTSGSGAQEIFRNAENLESVDLTGIQSTYLYWAFMACHSLEWYHGKSGPKNVLNLQWRNVSRIQGNLYMNQCHVYHHY